MKRLPTIIAATGMAAMFTFAAHADVQSVKKLPDGQNAKLSGTVESVSDARNFTIADPSGKINVQIMGNESMVLQKGKPVTVSGVVNHGLTDTTLQARSIDIKENVAGKVGDALDSVTGGLTSEAKNVQINALPKTGTVRLTGTVSDVEDEKNFTLSDPTGKVDVAIKSNEAAALTEGAEVTVIGNVDSGLMGKSIEASHVIVRADAPQAKQNR